MTATTEQRSSSTGPAFQSWMFANVAIGAGFSAFVALLVPPYITQATGSASEAGVVMSLMSLAAILGPVFGGIADRYNAHRYVMVGGLAAMTLALVGFGLASGDSEFQVIDALIMGLGVAGASAVAPVFIVSAGLSEALQAKRLTAFSIAFPAGQVAGGMMLAAAAQAEWSFSQRFYLGAVVLGLCTVIVWFTSAAPTAAIKLDDEDPDDQPENVDSTRRTGFRGVIFSLFGLYILVLVLSSVANNGINSQIANILPNLYGISETATSTLISVAGLLNILLFFAAAKAMTNYGPLAPFLAGTVMRFGGALGLGALGLVTNAPVLLVAAAMQLLYQGSPFARLPQNVLAVRFAPIPSGQANGWVIAGSAMGSFIGSLLGGWLADAVGYNAINWMGAIAAGAAVGLIVLFIAPLNKQRYGDDDDEEQAGAGSGAVQPAT